MTNLVISTVHDSDVDGMSKAGEEIAALLAEIADDESKSASFFGDLWNNLEAGDVAGNPNPGDLVDPPAEFQHKCRLIAPNKKDQRIFRNSVGGSSNKEYAAYTYDLQEQKWKQERKFKPNPVLDKPESNGNGPYHMTIPIPVEGRNLTSDETYLGMVIDNIQDILGATPGDAEFLKARQYLLAVIFLNRCQ